MASEATKMAVLGNQFENKNLRDLSQRFRTLPIMHKGISIWGTGSIPNVK